MSAIHTSSCVKTRMAPIPETGSFFLKSVDRESILAGAHTLFHIVDYVFTHVIFIYMYTYLYIYMYKYTYIFTYGLSHDIYICDIYIYIYIFINIYTHRIKPTLHIFQCWFDFVCIYIYIYIYTSIYICA